MSWVIFILIVLHIGVISDAQSLTLGMNATIALKSSSLELVCRFSPLFVSNGISITKDGQRVTTCSAAIYRCTYYKAGYNFACNQTGVFVIMKNVSREANGIWSCGYTDPTLSLDVKSNSLNITVYTIPAGLNFTQVPNMNVDLSVTSARLQCTTFGCTYPSPSIQWLTQVPFFIQNLPVRVTEAFLQQNNQNITSTLIVNSAEQVTLTCVMGTSRPSPNIDWYIGSKLMGNGTSLFFTPSTTDHNEVIFCQAYNIDPNLKVDSNKPRLFVQVKVTVAALQQNGQTISDPTLIVTSGKPTTLSCVTGNSRPDPKIDWYIGSEKRGNGTSLNFIPTSEDHDKAIYCQAYNIDPNQPVFSKKTILFVRAAPRILDVSPDYKGYIGQCAIIQFDFYSNTDENLTVTARHSNSSGLIHQGIIKPTHLDDPPISVFRASLFISLLNDNDFGLYDTEVKNAVGSDSKNIKIIDTITPEKPFNFHTTNVQEKQLSLRWQAGYNGGYTQTFIVEISLDNITWNNVSQVIAGNKDGWFTAVIEDLIPGSEYYLRLYAYNINGRGDFADLQLVIRMLKGPSSSEVGASAGIGVGGAVGIGVRGVVLGLIAAFIAMTIRRQLKGPTNSCFRIKGKTDDAMHTYSNTEMNPQPVKPIYEELNKGNTELSVYDKISPLEGQG